LGKLKSKFNLDELVFASMAALVASSGFYLTAMALFALVGKTIA
jgi:hypothetical protein